jgi:hypothetical protein
MKSVGQKLDRSYRKAKGMCIIMDIKVSTNATKSSSAIKFKASLTSA